MPATTQDLQSGRPARKKVYYAKFYAENGDYIGTAKDISFDGFTKTINGGLGELIIPIIRPFDDFSEGDQIDFMHIVQVAVVDKESGAEGETVYRGFVDSISPAITGNQETVTVRALGFATRLADVMYKNGTTIQITASALDPAQIVRNVLDRFTAEDWLTGSQITYTANSIENTGNTMSYTFIENSCFDAIEKAKSASPANFYWYVNENGLFKFHNKPRQATHTFTFGKDIETIRVDKNIRDVINQVILWNGQTGGSNLLRSYKDATSIATYGKRVAQKTDRRWGNTGTMDNVGRSIINVNKDPNVKVTLTIIDSNTNELGYDIESINPGDTCKVLNLPETSTTLDDNMVITTVRYRLGYVELELEELRQTLTKKFADLTSDFATYVYNGNDATTYTEVT